MLVYEDYFILFYVYLIQLRYYNNKIFLMLDLLNSNANKKQNANKYMTYIVSNETLSCSFCIDFGCQESIIPCTKNNASVKRTNRRYFRHVREVNTAIYMDHTKLQPQRQRLTMLALQQTGQQRHYNNS